MAAAIMANVSDLDHVVANAIENLVRISSHEPYSHLGIVRFVTAVRVLNKQSDSIADGRQHSP